MAKKVRITLAKAIAKANLRRAETGEKPITMNSLAVQAGVAATTITRLARTDDKAASALSLDLAGKILTALDGGIEDLLEVVDRRISLTYPDISGISPMGWSFRRRIKAIPGVYLNVSKRGISTTIGVRGASLTLRGDGTYANAGIPGTGISNRQKISRRRSNLSAPTPSASDPSSLPPERDSSTPPDYQYVSSDPLEITSQGLQGFQIALLEANRQSLLLQKDLANIQSSKLLSRFASVLLRVFLLYYLVPPIRRSIDRRIQDQYQAIFQVKRSIVESSVPLEVEMDADTSSSYRQCISVFRDVTKSEFIWDITSASDVDRVTTRSAADLAVSRRRTTFGIDSVSGISCSYPSAHLRNLNGADIYIYPGFFVMFKSQTQLGIVDLVELQVSFSTTQFVEQETVPSDSRRVGEVWERSNKDGSRDMRYAKNKPLPLMEYGEITFSSTSGIHEKYMVSNCLSARAFVDAFQTFIVKLAV
jgi:hypothetical protein